MDIVFQYTDESAVTVTVLDTQQDVMVVHYAPNTIDAFEMIMPERPADGQKITLTSVNGIASLTMTSTIEILSPRDTLIRIKYGDWIYSAFLNKYLRIG